MVIAVQCVMKAVLFQVRLELLFRYLTRCDVTPCVESNFRPNVAWYQRLCTCDDFIEYGVTFFTRLLSLRENLFLTAIFTFGSKKVSTCFSHISWAIPAKLSIRNLYIMRLINCEFREKPRSKCHTLLKVVYDILEAFPLFLSDLDEILYRRHTWNLSQFPW